MLTYIILEFNDNIFFIQKIKFAFALENNYVIQMKK